MKRFLHKYSIKLPIQLEDDDYLKVEISSIVGITELDKTLKDATERGKINLKRMNKDFRIGLIEGVCKKMMELSSNKIGKLKLEKEIIEITETKQNIGQLLYQD